MGATAPTTDAGGLVGRGAECRRLDAALATLRSARAARVLAVSGEPGIGKSRLLRELAIRARGQHGTEVLHGRAAEFEEDLPYGVLVEALDEHLDRLDRTRLRGLDGLAELAAVFPALEDLARGTPALAAERYRAHRAVRGLLERLAATRPLVLVLDDLHWADPASLEVIAAMLRRPPAARILIAIAYRSGRIGPRAAEAVAVAERDGHLERLDLAPLSRGDAEPLLAPFAAPMREAVFRESGGNPFYLEQLSRAPRRAASAGSADVPPPIAEALAGELADLDPVARRLLEGAAVAGEPFDVDVAAAAAVLEDDVALHALDVLTALGLVRPTDVPRRFTFRHPLVRRAVYEGAGSGWRLGAHARVATVLARRGDAPAARAHHVEHSARAGDEEAIAVLRAAGAAMGARAPATAARWHRAALRLLAGEDPRRLAVLEDLAEAEGAAGHLDAARGALLDALATARTRAERVRLTAACAAVEHWSGRHADARRRLEAAVRDGGDEAVLRVELAFDALYGLDLGRSQALAREALAAARGAEDDATAAAAGALLALGLAAEGRREEAQAERAAAVRLLDGLTPDASNRRLDVLWHLAWTETFLDRYEDAIARSREALDRSRATGQGRLVVPLLLAQVFPLEQVGRIDEAIEVSAVAVEAARLSGIAHHLFWALWEQAVALIFAGQLREARLAAEESVALSEGLERNVLWEAEPHWALAGTLIELGEGDHGLRLLLEGFGGRDAPRVVPAERAIAFEMLADVELARGEIEAAAAAADACERHASAIGRPLAHVLAGRASAAVSLARGRPAEAIERARAGVAAAEAVDAWLEGERTRVVLGRALAAAGRREEAVAELRAAERRLGSQGARTYHRHAVRELRRLGHRAERAAGTGEAPGELPLGALKDLSDREREVAELAASGNTNQQIADRLVVSRKTVETHLRSVFRKLGLASRVELTRVVLEASAAESARVQP